MFKSFIASFPCLLLFVVGTGATIWLSVKTCPDIPVKEDFDLAEYMGKWYLVRATTSLLIKHSQCITQEYSQIDEKSFNVSMEKVSKVFGLVSPTGVARAYTQDEAKFQVSLRSLIINVKMPYWILDTDYNNYAVVWSCKKEMPFSIRQAWILTRDAQPSTEILEQAENVFKEHSINAKLREIKQTNCD